MIRPTIGLSLRERRQSGFNEFPTLDSNQDRMIQRKSQQSLKPAENPVFFDSILLLPPLQRHSQKCVEFGATSLVGGRSVVVNSNLVLLP